MPNWSGSVLTKKGLQLQAKAEAGATLNLTKIKLGSGILQSGQDVQNLTDLIHLEQEISIAQKTVSDNGTCTISGIITNEGLTSGYLIRECGVYAQDPDEGEILYAIATDPNPDYLPAQGGTTAISQEFAIPIIASNVANITAQINLNSLATLSYVLNMIKSLFGIAEATTDAIKNKVKEWALEKINEWVETLGIAYNIEQNGYICLGVLFGNAIIQWGMWEATTSSIDQYKNGVYEVLSEIILPIMLTEKIYAAVTNAKDVANGANEASWISWFKINVLATGLRCQKSAQTMTGYYFLVGK